MTKALLFKPLLPNPKGAEWHNEYIARCYLNKKRREHNRRMMCLLTGGSLISWGVLMLGILLAFGG